MPHFVFQGTDRPGAQALRAQLREEHRAHIRQDRPDCRTVLGGPLLSEDGEMFSTLLVFEATDPDAVRRFVANDPYTRGGLFETVRIDRWQWGLGQPAP